MVSAALPPRKRPAKSAHVLGPHTLCKPAAPVLCSQAAGGFDPLALFYFSIFQMDPKPCKLKIFCASMV
jgi:hypothetical protein